MRACVHARTRARTFFDPALASAALEYEFLKGRDRCCPVLVPVQFPSGSAC